MPQRKAKPSTTKHTTTTSTPPPEERWKTLLIEPGPWLSPYRSRLLVQFSSYEKVDWLDRLD